VHHITLICYNHADGYLTLRIKKGRLKFHFTNPLSKLKREFSDTNLRLGKLCQLSPWWWL